MTKTEEEKKIVLDINKISVEYIREILELLNLESPTYTSVEYSNEDDWKYLFISFLADLIRVPDRIIAIFELGKNEDIISQPLSRYEHSLQTATLAYRDGRDDEYVICALLHDIGSQISGESHAEISASMLKSYVKPEYYWMVLNHNKFQGYHYWHYIGLNRNESDKLKDHPWYQLTYDFVEKYDTPAFDPNGEILPLEFFKPMIRKVFTIRPWVIKTIKKFFPFVEIQNY